MYIYIYIYNWRKMCWRGPSFYNDRRNLRKCKCKDLVLVVYACNLKEKKKEYSKYNWKSRFLWYSPLIHQCIQTFGISERNVNKWSQIWKHFVDTCFVHISSWDSKWITVFEYIIDLIYEAKYGNTLLTLVDISLWDPKCLNTLMN
jgi:hypothetical protein